MTLGGTSGGGGGEGVVGDLLVWEGVETSAPGGWADE